MGISNHWITKGVYENDGQWKFLKQALYELFEGPIWGQAFANQWYCNCHFHAEILLKYHNFESWHYDLIFSYNCF